MHAGCGACGAARIPLLVDFSDLLLRHYTYRWVSRFRSADLRDPLREFGLEDLLELVVVQFTVLSQQLLVQLIGAALGHGVVAGVADARERA